MCGMREAREAQAQEACGALAFASAFAARGTHISMLYALTALTAREDRDRAVEGRQASGAAEEELEGRTGAYFEQAVTVDEEIARLDVAAHTQNKAHININVNIANK